jgi:hypothetical protein
MSPADLQTRYDHLLKLVSTMRNYQNRYRQYRVGKDKETARRYERQVDDLIRLEQENKSKKQGEIF